MEKGFLESKVFLASPTELQQLGRWRGQTSIDKTFSGFTSSRFEHTGSQPYQCPGYIGSQQHCSGSACGQLCRTSGFVLALAVVELRFVYSRIRNCLDTSCLLGVDRKAGSLLLIRLKKRLFNLKLRLSM